MGGGDQKQSGLNVQDSGWEYSSQTWSSLILNCFSKSLFWYLFYFSQISKFRFPRIKVLYVQNVPKNI